MLGWLLANCPPTDLRPGVVVLPRWMDTDDARRLAEAIAELSTARLPVLELPLARLLAADPAQRAQTRGVIVLSRPESPIGPELLPLAVVLIVGGDSAPTSLRAFRDGLRMSLTRALTVESHPLRLLGAGPWLTRLVAERATEPLELLDLLDAAIQHRRRYAEQDEDAWARSVQHAAGALVARRLRRLPAETRWDALRALLALPASAEGVVAAEGLGLLAVEAAGPRPVSLARGLLDGETRGGLLSGLEGEALPEDLREVLVPAPEEPSVLSVSSPTPSAAGGSYLLDAVRAWIGGLTDAKDAALLTRGLDTLALASRAAHYSEDARLSAVGPVVLALRAARGNGAAEALAELIVLTAAWLPADEEAQAGALEALRRLYAQAVIPKDVWAAALLRRAFRLLGAPKVNDMRDAAEASLREVADLGTEGRVDAERLLLVGYLADQRVTPTEALMAYQAAAEGFGLLGYEHDKAVALAKVADMLQAKGQIDEALKIRRDDLLPVFEQFNDPQGIAVTHSKIADVLQGRGLLDEALRIRQDLVLPLFQQLGDALSVAITKGKIANVLQAQQQFDDALRIRNDEVLPILELFGDTESRAATLSKTAEALQASGQPDEALRVLREEVLPVYVRLGDVRSKAVAMSIIADVLQAQGQLDEALRIRTDDVLPVVERLGDIRGKAIMVSKVADVLLAQGQIDEALELWRDEVLPAFDKLGDVRNRTVTLSKIADALQTRGKFDEALSIREQELQVFEQFGDVRSRAVTMSKIADILQARGQLDESLRICREEVLPVVERLGDALGRAIVMGKIADILEVQGQLDDALRIRREDELPIFERLGLQREAQVSKAKLAINLLLRRKPKLRAEARALLTTALESAIMLNLPADAEQIRAIFRQYNLRLPT